MFWMERLCGAAAAVYAVLALVGIGAAATGRAGWRPSLPLARVTFGFVVGCGLVVPLLIALSLTRGITRGAALGIGVLAVVPAWRGAQCLRGLRVRLVPLLGALLIAAPYLLQTMLPDHDWDSPSYHVPTARLYLASSAWATDYHLAQVNFPGAVHLLYAGFLALGLDAALIPFNFLGSLLVLAASAVMAHELFGPRAARWAFWLTATNHILLELGLDARIDNFLALWVVVAAHALVVWHAAPRESAPRVPLLVCALALGLALGTKYSGVLFTLALAPVALHGLVIERRARLATLGLAALAGALPSAFWYVRNLVVLRDPVYPFASERVYADATGATRPWGPAIAALIAREGMPDANALGPFAAASEARTNLVDHFEILREPDLYENKHLHFVSPLALVGFLLLFASRARTARATTVILATSWIALSVGPPTSRYMLPTFVLATIAGSVVLASVETRWLRRVLVALVAFLVVRQTIQEWRKVTLWPPLEGLARAVQWEAHPTPQEWLWIERLEPWKLLTGQEDELHWLARVGYNRATVSPNAALWLRAELAAGRIAPGGAIFAIGEDKQGHIPLPLLADMSRECFRWLIVLVRNGGDHDAAHRELWSSGVRWFLENTDYVKWCRRNVVWEEHTDRLRKRDFVFSHVHLQRFLAERTDVAHEWPTFARFRKLRPPR